MPQMRPGMHPGDYIPARPLSTGGQDADASDEPEDLPSNLHASFASFSPAQAFQPGNGKRPMTPMSPSMPPEAPRYELASLVMLIFVDQDGFETETLRPRASTTWGQEGM